MNERITKRIRETHVVLWALVLLLIAVNISRYGLPLPVENSKIAPPIVNINSASVYELITLPGIGEVKAQAIIDYRNSNGPFQSLSQIMEVKGIGEKTYEQIQPLISIEDQST